MAITFDIGFRLKGQSLDEVVKPSLQSLSKEIDFAFQNAVAKNNSLSKPINEAITAANALGTALKNAQTDKGLSFSAMEQSLARSGMTVSQMVAKLGSAGPAFQQSFNLALNSIATANRGVTVLSSKLQEAGRVFSQAFKFTIANQSIRFLQSAIQDSVNWVKDLDSTLAQISVVTGKVGTQLDGVYENIVQGAADLRVAASEYAEASVIFYQQGLNDDEVARRTEITIEAAKAAGQSVETMASQLTAIWNSYNMLGEEQERAAAVGAKLAASNAVNFKDIAEAMQVSAAGASQMGVSYDSLAAIIATVGDVTQQSASVIGNAYKTIFSRFEQLTTTGTDGEVTLNSVSSKLQALGVQIMDSSGKLKNLEEIIYNTGMSWETYSEEQQLAIAQLAGGTRQYGQFLALMQNFPKYLKNLDIASKETGSTLIEQFMAARDSVETAAEMSKEAWSKAFKDLFKADSMKDLYKVSEKIANIVQEIISAFGGLRGILIEIGFIFQKQIADKIAASSISLKNVVQNLTPALSKNTIEKEQSEQRDSLKKSFQTQRDINTDKNGKFINSQEAIRIDNDESGALKKLQITESIKKQMVDINALAAKGNQETKDQAKNLEVQLSAIQTKYNSAIDSVSNIARSYLDINKQIDLQLAAMGTEESIITDLSDDDQMRLTVLQEQKTIAEAKNALINEEYKTQLNCLTTNQSILTVEIQKLEAKKQQLESERGKEGADNTRIDKQIADIEKLQTTYKNAAKQLKTEAQNVQKAWGESSSNSVKAIKDIDKAINEVKSSGKEITKTSLQMQKSFGDMGAKLGKAFNSDDIKGNIGKALEETQNQITYQFKELKDNKMFAKIFELSDEDINASNLDNFIKSLSDKIKAFNSQEGNKFKFEFDTKSLYEMTAQAKVAAEEKAKLTRSEENLKAAMQASQKGIGSYINSFTQLGTSILSLGNGFNSLFTAMNEGTLTFTKLLTITLQIIPALNRMTQSQILMAAAQRLITTTNAEGELILNKKRIATIAAKYANDSLVASEGEVAAATAVASAGLTVLIGLLIAVVAAIANKVKADREAKTEAMNSAYETLQASKDLSEGINEEAKAFEEAAEKAKKYSKDTEKVNEAHEAMKQSVDNIISKLKESEDAHDKAKAKEFEHLSMIVELTGSYDDLIEKVKELNGELLKGTINDSKTALATAQSAFQSDMRKGFRSGINPIEDTFNIDIGNDTTGRQNKNEVGKALTEVIDEKGYSHINRLSGNISSDTSLKGMISAYEEMLDLQSELAKQGFASSEYYRKLSEQIEKVADSYAKMVNSAESFNETSLSLLEYDSNSFVDNIFEDATNKTKLQQNNIEEKELRQALAIPEGGFKNIEQYENFRQALLDLADAGIFAQETIESFLNTSGDTASLEAVFDNIQTQKDKVALALENGNITSLDAQVQTDNLQDDLKLLTDEELALMIDFEFDPLSMDSVWEQMQNHLKKKGDLQVVAQINEEITTIRKDKDIVKNLDDGGTLSSDDYSQLSEQYKQFFVQTEEGLYQLQTSAEEFKQSIESAEQSALLEKAKTSTEKADYYSKGGDNGTAQDYELGEDFAQQAQQAQEQLLMTADSVIELDSLMKQLVETMGDQGASYNAYANALISLGYEYDNCSQEIKAYQEALASGDISAVESAEKALKASVLLGETAKKYNEDIDVLEQQAQDLAEKYGYSAQQAAQVVTNNLKLESGIQKLSKGLKDWQKNLTPAKKGTKEYAEATVGVTDAVKDLVGAQDDFKLPKDFLESPEKMKLLEEAANGSQHAINELGIAIAETQVSDKVDEAKKNIMDNAGNDQESQMAAMEQVSKIDAAAKVVNDGIANIKNNLTELENGADLSSIFEGGDAGVQNFIDNLNTLAMETGMTVDEMNGLLSEVGLTADVTTTDVVQTETVPAYEEKIEPMDPYIAEATVENSSLVDGEDGPLYKISIPQFKKYTDPNGSKTVTKTVQVPQISSDGTSPGAAKVQYAGTAGGGGGRGKGAGSGGSGGGGGKKSTSKKNAKKTAKTKKERYTDNENAISDLATSVEKLSTANDHAWGTQRIRNLNLINKLLGEQAQKYRDLRTEAKRNIELDRKDVEAGLREWNKATNQNLALEFDENGLPNNIQAIQNAYADYINDNFISKINYWEDKIQQALKKDENATTIDTGETFEEIEEKIEKIKEASQEFSNIYEDLIEAPMDLLVEAIQKAEEALKKEVDTLHQYLQQKIETYTIKMELHIEISDLERQLNNALINSMGEVGKASKQVADMIRDNLKATAGDVDEVIEHFHNMENVQEQWANRDLGLKEQFNISDEAWNRALEDGLMPSEIKDAMEQDIQTLFSKREDILSELDRSWQNYIDTIAYYIGEYDRLTGRLDKQAEISDNLLSIIETTGLKYKYGADETSAMYKNMNAQFDMLNNKAKLVMSEMKVVSDTRKQAEEELNDILKGRSYKQFADEATEEEMYRYNKIKALYDEQLELEEDLNAQRIALMEEAYSKAADYAAQWGEQISHEFQEALGGMFDTLDEAMDMYSQKYDIDTFFMDEYDKTFELSKLQHDINKVIDDISNPEQLARYNALLEEIEAKKAEGVKITEKDLEILQAQFDLEQARDAYEDARNAKNTMRLTRDASGNYSYVYSGDSSGQEDKAMEIEEKLHNIYKLNRDAADEYSEQWLQLQVDWQNYIDSIDQARYDQDVKYRDMVNQRMVWYAEQSDLLSGEIIKHNDAIGRNFEDTTLGIITNQESMEAANNLYKQNHTELKDKLVQNYQEWIDKADATRIEVGGAMESLEETVDRETEAMMEHVDKLGDEIENFTYEAESDMAQYADFVSDWSAEVCNYFQDVINKIYKTIKVYQDLLANMEKGLSTGDDSGEDGYDETKDYSTLALRAYGAGDMEKYNQYLEWRDRKLRENPEGVSTTTGKNLFNADATSWIDNNTLEMIAEVYKQNEKAGTEILGALQKLGDNAEKYDYYKLIYDLLNTYKVTVQESLLKTIQDKAYAVEDNPNSRRTASGGLISTPQVRSLAEEGPELVLNAEDTQKILEAVRNVRALTMQQLSSAFQYQSQRASMISDMATQAAEWLSYKNAESAPQAIEQNVHIEATFSDATTADQIEAAFNQLIVQAAHYSITNK